MMRFVAGALLVTLACEANAQELKVGSSPVAGVETTASVGNVVYQRFRYATVPAFEISDRVQAKIMYAEVDIPAGAQLVQIKSKTKLKACYVSKAEDIIVKRYYGCLMDDDGDGTFDRVAGNEVQGGKKIASPVSYKPAELILPTATQNFKQTVTFLGFSNNTLRLSYREFMNDMARPAFTEEYTFPLSDQFPQQIAFKDVKLVVSSVDGAGLHYSVQDQ